MRLKAAQDEDDSLFPRFSRCVPVLTFYQSADLEVGNGVAGEIEVTGNREALGVETHRTQVLGYSVCQSAFCFSNVELMADITHDTVNHIL